jgi:hypothetical protein
MKAAAAAALAAYVTPSASSRRLITHRFGVRRVLFALTAASAVLTREPTTTPLITIAAVLATATLLP